MAKAIVENKIVQETSAPAPDHFHHWKIEEPNGERSRGVCKHCGAERFFKNWLADGDFITNEEHRSAA